MKHLARALRNNQTDAEKRLWHVLRNRQLSGFKFRRQYIIKPYIVDFICIEKKLIVELDGGHHAEQVVEDDKRRKFLEQKGYKVIRFWNNEVLSNMEGVLCVITKTLDIHPSPPPSPLSRERGNKSV